jgi:hypothetical protein
MSRTCSAPSCGPVEGEGLKVVATAGARRTRWSSSGGLQPTSCCWTHELGDVRPDRLGLGEAPAGARDQRVDDLVGLGRSGKRHDADLGHDLGQATRCFAPGRSVRLALAAPAGETLLSGRTTRALLERVRRLRPARSVDVALQAGLSEVVP